MDHFASLFDRALDAVVGMDHRGDVVAWNKAAEELFGWSRDEVIGRPMGSLIVPLQHRASHAKGLSHYNRTGEGPVLEQRLKLTAVDRSNIEFPVELSIFPMRQQDGDIFYAFIRSLLYEEARQTEQERRAREADVALQVAKNLMEDISLEEFTQLCLKAVCNVAGLDAAHVFYVRGADNARRLVPSGIWFVSDARFRPVAEDTAARTFEKGEGLPGQAWARKEVVTIHSISEEKEFIRRDSFSRVGLNQGIAVPIALEESIFAVMEFFGTEKARIDEEMIRLVRTVAFQIGSAIQRKKEAERRDIMRRELAHRVGNSFAVLNAILRSSASNSTSVSEFASSFSARLQAVSRANRSISQTEGQLPLSELVDEAFELLPDGKDPQVCIPDWTVTTDAVLPLSLLFSELVTNHLKHGNPEHAGKIHISVQDNPTDSFARILWREPRSTKPESSRTGYGSILIKSMVEGQLSGTIKRSFGEDGFSAEIELPKAIFDGSCAS